MPMGKIRIWTKIGRVDGYNFLMGWVGLLALWVGSGQKFGPVSNSGVEKPTVMVALCCFTDAELLRQYAKKNSFIMARGSDGVQFE